MSLRVIVWGTGNVGRPAIRAILTHRELELTGVIVANPDKVGVDVGVLAGLSPIGLAATDDWRSLLAAGADAVVYAATADTRPEAAMADLIASLKAGCNVVASGLYLFLHPETTLPDLLAPVQAACERGSSSLFVSGIDPGWAMDMLPALVSGTSSAITEIRSREIFNYALYDQPRVVRDVIGFGGSMDTLPLMLHDFAIEMVWGPMVRLVGEALGCPVTGLEINVERQALQRDIRIPTMGLFETGTQGAFRFEVCGVTPGEARFVLEHITRIDDTCAPDWPYPPEGQGCHQVIIRGNPTVTLSLHAEDEYEIGAGGGGNASAACWLVNAIPAVCSAQAGVLTMLDLPRIDGSGQLGTRLP
ncbi:MAG: hypothetical protein RJQ10_15160 [Haliea sp.]|uniref:NAD(P)H-dependent amine dehydrogenase family protein n=1 Tax=Haliea sp. TaxID=1932666 RepID=UPI0032EFBC3E